jgi:hypothetical protein
LPIAEAMRKDGIVISHEGVKSALAAGEGA